MKRYSTVVKASGFASLILENGDNFSITELFWSRFCFPNEQDWEVKLFFEFTTTMFENLCRKCVLSGRLAVL